MKIRHSKSRLTPLNLYQLRKYCKKHEIDYYEIDSGINYAENLQYLKSIAKMTEKVDLLDHLEDLAERYVDVEAEKEKQWINDYPFKFIMACALYGELKPIKIELSESPLRFSLKTKTHQGFSLRNLVKSQKS